MDVPTSAPHDCPGTQSEQAGKESSCAGCPNQKICSLGKAREVDPAIEQIAVGLAPVKHKILVLSGKGGVGKSTFSTCLARAFAYDQKLKGPGEEQIGLLDIDICGPSVPTMLGLEKEQVHQSGSGWSPVYADENLAVMSIGFLLGSPDDAVIWRGPKKNTMIKNFLRDVDWGPLDWLVIDTPPGTSDEHLSIVQYLSRAGIDGALIVTTPQEISLQDVRKEIDFCRKVGVKVLGVVENMSGFVCPGCKNESKIFPASTGGAAKMCDDLGLDFLGRVPLDPMIGRCCDEGLNFLDELPDSLSTKAILDIVSKIRKSAEADQDETFDGNEHDGPSR